MSLLNRLLYKGRDLRYRQLFGVLREHCRGSVVDVGGGNFVASAKAQGISFESWTVIEPMPISLPHLDMSSLHLVVGDGQRLGIRTDTFDTTVSIQVLEHVFEPIRMIEELHRVTKPGGTMIVLIPQTANIHLAPHHYQNFTRYWLEEATRRLDVEVIERYALGGAWSSVASRLVMQYPASFGVNGFRHPGVTRNWRFWCLLPVGIVVSIVTVPLALLLSLGDLEEEANNHLFVLRKRDAH
jgi:SAM-dependent methyltransferase